MAEARRRRARGGAARTREVLLQAAAEVFAERGYDGASVDEIAGAAGVSVGSIYSRFGSKRNLFRQLMTQYMERDLIRVRDGFAAGPEGGLRALDDLVQETATSRRQTLLDAETWASAMRTPALRSLLAEHENGVQSAAAALVRRGRAETGHEFGVPDDELAVLLTSLFHGLCRQHRLDPGSVPPGLYTRTVTALSRGLAEQAAGADRPGH
ncbi:MULTISPECIES: TetR/AcrR family transcriptional regulator [Pseudonocardia]|uniref:HTH-type transcriptional repressor BepR n=2 Tax=Pseudonocardia TaxID=1847 RepID=A0A1Y2N4I2_PSEAH|nr:MULTISPECIES: TetR/AcrR family transcriptional regulator [Pseudonocardia]OSY41818.1 HTH-type transcriptional repressor BepR [Pseudonocardia autotrophica]TDN71130.1 TetR family transcriptional regulator [Pseudonocardia autotrophica]BBG01800.1 hypothetical protein Pdca_30090 [Pseudonocardia autotrophica]GEC26251.1 hypothetical protein PSA01_32800 [Pseudonocardia saturnea]